MATDKRATRSLAYVAMTRGRDTNTAYLYERTPEHEYRLEPAQGAHVMDRRNSRHAGRLLRSIIANDDQPVTAHAIAARTPSRLLPDRARTVRGYRAAAVQRRRRSYEAWQTDAQSLARVVITGREHSRSRHHSLDDGIEM